TDATATLTLTSVGNIAVTATLADEIDADLALTGLPPSITLNPGQTATNLLTLSPAANAPLAVPLSATVTATFGDVNNPQSASSTVALTLVAAQAQSAFEGAQAAAALGRTDIATTLSDLASSIDGLAANPGSSAEKAAVL